MTETPTPLDAAHAAMTAAPEDGAARLRFFERVLDAELFVLLDADPTDERIRPRLVDLDAGRFALAFDRDARLGAFLDAPAPYAALPGRRLAAALAGRGVGLALNPGVAPSAALLTAAEIDWLAGMAAVAAETAPARVRTVGPPTTASTALIEGLGPKLAAMAGQIEAAWLGALQLEDGTERLALAVAGAPDAAQPAIAAAIAEAVRFSGAPEETLDVTFLPPGVAARAAFERAGMRFRPPPAPEPTPAPSRAGPGRDPARPPRLR